MKFSQALISNKLLFFFEKDFNYYLFEIIKNECEKYYYVLEDISDCDSYKIFEFVTTLHTGVYILNIFGQDNNLNLDPYYSEFIFSDKIFIKNNIDYCNNILVTNDFTPIITNDNKFIIIR